MSAKYYLTIKDLPQKGMIFKVEIDSWSFANKSFSRSGLAVNQTLADLLGPLYIYRKQDKHSHIFRLMNAERLKFLDKQRDHNAIFPEASLTLDRYSKPDSLLNREIIDFSDFELTDYNVGINPHDGTWDYHETAEFKFAKANLYYSSVESITTP
jgi:hypothetical protein